MFVYAVMITDVLVRYPTLFREPKLIELYAAANNALVDVVVADDLIRLIE